MKLSDLVVKEIKGIWGDEPKLGDRVTPVIKTNDMSYEGYIAFGNLTYRTIPENKLINSYLNTGDLLIEKSGGTKTHSVGYVNIFEGESNNYVCNNFILALRLNDKIVIPKYIFYQLKYKYESGLFSDCYNKTTGIQNLQVKTYLSKDVVVHSYTEQKRIIDELDEITSLIHSNKNKIDILNESIKSRFIEMFKTIDLSLQKEEWIELEKLSKIYTGTTPSTNDSTNWDGDILWITPAEMNKDTFYVYDTARKITEKGRKSKSLALMPVDTVLLSTRAPIGKVGIVGKSMTCNQGFKNFKCDDRINPIFLYILLKNNTEYLNSLGSGTTFLEVSKSKIRKMKIPVPEIKLQNEFSSFVKLIDKSKFVVQQQINALQELLDRKMDEYFGTTDGTL